MNEDQLIVLHSIILHQYYRELNQYILRTIRQMRTLTQVKYTSARYAMVDMSTIATNCQFVFVHKHKVNDTVGRYVMVMLYTLLVGQFIGNRTD